jgi:hypothetical protein
MLFKSIKDSRREKWVVGGKQGIVSEVERQRLVVHPQRSAKEFKILITKGLSERPFFS